MKSENITTASLIKATLFGYIALILVFYTYHYFTSDTEPSTLSRLPFLPFIEAGSIYLISLIVLLIGGIMYGTLGGKGVLASIKIALSKINYAAGLLFVAAIVYIKL